MEMQMKTFDEVLKRTKYRGRIIPLQRVMQKSVTWDIASVLQGLEQLYRGEAVISDWHDYKNMRLCDLWYLAIAQFIYAQLSNGEFCRNADCLAAFFDFLFGQDAYGLPKMPGSLPALALRRNERDHLREGDVSQLILDIDLASNPPNKYKYICHYLYTNDEAGNLAELLDRYGDMYPSPIAASVLVPYWIDKRLHGKDEGCLEKALRHVLSSPENQKEYAAGLLPLLDGGELMRLLPESLAESIPEACGINLSYRDFLLAIAPLAETVLRHFHGIPENDLNYYDERLCMLCSRSLAFQKVAMGGKQNA